ncbi:MerR family transcriptional regulator [Georgenia sp. Z1344]|uniref:MerR family transcriptional regulator n=1 Tax=Georgenia sp. Z1344 TaxID=3416706 RepID=UPI003CF2C907
MPDQEWSMQEIVRLTGTTSRTLRHYQAVGLLVPARTGHGGVRFYDRAGLLRLQQILVLRELGLGLPRIGEVLEEDVPVTEALRAHAERLDLESERLRVVAGSVRSTITMIDEGGELVARDMFDGFDHTQHKDEVEERWGHQAYTDSDAWWRSLTDADKAAFQREIQDVAEGFGDASARGLDVRSDEVQALARRQYDWIGSGWGGTSPSREAFIGLGQMYVDDPRFGATYSDEGRSYAAYVRDAMTVFAEDNLA